ncbi:MAG: UDP-N-acetylglucosamine 4-epimerase [Candidatus Marinimicrobia bacterium]|nr:UDP-N-acetylglucosamine 4-epimerase [Candidatus Neomarinimicrobiota bacterium]|tara:strand:+ start:423 stop:1406 length:984 start_codon:yes stop_codon:yes gene_type:complete
MSDTISIVGASGFLGTRLSKRLNESKIDHYIYDISFPRESKNFIDVEDIDSLDTLKHSSIIINLAAIHRDDVKPVSRYDDVNVNGAVNICECARKFGINKIIFTSSVAIYGFAPKNTAEDGEPNYFNDYGRTKYEAELVYKEWQKEDPSKRSLVIIRPTVIFGEGNRGNVYNLLNQINKKRFVMVGNGKNIKSMAYVANVAAFLEHVIKKSEGIHIFNYVDKPDLNMNNLIKLVRKTLFKKNNVGMRLPVHLGLLLGYIADFISTLIRKSLPLSSIRVKKFVSDTMFSSKIDDTNFKPPFNLTDGLINTIKYEFLEDNKHKKKFYTE